MNRITNMYSPVWTIPKTDKFTSVSSSNIKNKVFKPKKSGTKASHIIFILDSSSSMNGIKAGTIDGFNEFLDIHKKESKEDGVKTYISLYSFNGYSTKKILDRKNVNSVENLTDSSYNPSGMTNLYDSIGKVMRKINNKVSKYKKSSRDSLIFVVLTDGQDNTSKKYNGGAIKEMVELAEQANWGFTFLGTNIDTFGIGTSMGFNLHNTVMYKGANIKESIAAAGEMTSRLRTVSLSGSSIIDAYSLSGYTEKERLESVGSE